MEFMYTFLFHNICVFIIAGKALQLPFLQEVKNILLIQCLLQFKQIL